MKEENNKKDIITPFASTNFRDRKVFGIKSDDRRRHMYVIGKTGMGKSTLLENLVYSDIQNGYGVAYVDPHGDTAEKILKWIPEHRLKDVIYFNPSDLDNPIAFNVLEKVDPEYRNLVASGLVSVYKKLWADSWGPRLEYILRYCILALLDSPDATLMGINRILVDEKYRKIVVARVTDPVVRSFWEDEFTKWNDRVIAEVISPIQNKVGQFLSNTMIRNIVGQRFSSINLREIMDKKKILILNLSKGRMGEDASALLGAMMITKIQLAAMSRVDIPEEEREDFYLYVDEFQNFATESFATILSEARKYRLCLTMAHQYIAQLEQGGNTVVRDAVFGNVGTLVSFRVGATDAEFLEKEFAPHFLAEDIVNLPKYKIYLRLMIDGIATEPFSADALPPMSYKDHGLGDQVIKNTRENFTKSKEEVEESIKEWQEAEGGIVDKDQLIESTKNTKEAPDVLKVFEEIKAEEEKKKQKEAEKAKEKAERDARPILWRGHCDVGNEEIGLTFVPTGDKPILCQDHLREYRKGSLKGDQVDVLMEKVMQRKIENKKKGGGNSDYNKRADERAKLKANNSSQNNSKRHESKKRELPPINEGKPQIRIISDSVHDSDARIGSDDMDSTDSRIKNKKNDKADNTGSRIGSDEMDNTDSRIENKKNDNVDNTYSRTKKDSNPVKQAIPTVPKVIEKKQDDKDLRLKNKDLQSKDNKVNSSTQNSNTLKEGQVIEF